MSGIFSKDSARVEIDVDFTEAKSETDGIYSPFINVVLMAEERVVKVGTLLLANPPSCNVLDYRGLRRQCTQLFGYKEHELSLFADRECTDELRVVDGLEDSTIFLRRK